MDGAAAPSMLACPRGDLAGAVGTDAILDQQKLNAISAGSSTMHVNHKCEVAKAMIKFVDAPQSCKIVEFNLERHSGHAIGNLRSQALHAR